MQLKLAAYQILAYSSANWLPHHYFHQLPKFDSTDCSTFANFYPLAVDWNAAVLSQSQHRSLYWVEMLWWVVRWPRQLKVVEAPTFADCTRQYRPVVVVGVVGIVSVVVVVGVDGSARELAPSVVPCRKCCVGRFRHCCVRYCKEQQSVVVVELACVVMTVSSLVDGCACVVVVGWMNGSLGTGCSRGSCVCYCSCCYCNSIVCFWGELFTFNFI